MFPLLAVTKTVIQGIPMSHISIGLSFMGFMFVIPAIFDPKKFKSAMIEFLQSGNTSLRIAAIVNLIIAFLILNTHWTIKLSSTRSIMTAIGYLLVLRSALWLWFPTYSRSIMLRTLNKECSIYVMISIGLLFALGVGYLGVFVY